MLSPGFCQFVHQDNEYLSITRDSATDKHYVAPSLLGNSENLLAIRKGLAISTNRESIVERPLSVGIEFWILL